jgi:glutamate-1-semialdehyde aminotransferase
MEGRLMSWNRTKQLIPDGVQTLSKMPERHVNGVYPKYCDGGAGAYMKCGEKRYIDFPMGLGAVILGHANPVVNVAVKKRLDSGTIFSLPNYMETELAERIVSLIPSAEQCRFLKTGSESTSAAVKIARTYTNRKKVVACGYHGWHDWYSSTCRPAGTVDRHVTQLIYNDLGSFKKKITDKTAAVIMEPYVYEAPKDGFLQAIRRLCTEKGVVLIFDENVTGFRTKKLSAQALYKVTPDLTCLGKAMANGLPLSCVCGKKELMNVLTEDCFVSSTFGGDLVGIAAAIATIDIISQKGAHHLEIMGNKLKEAFNRYAQNDGLFDCKCIGFPQRTKFEFPTEAHRSLFWQECLGQGVFFGYAQFVSFAHNMPEMDKAVAAIRHGMSILRKNKDNPQVALRGDVATPALRKEVENEAGNTDTGRLSTGETVAKPSTGNAKDAVPTDGTSTGDIFPLSNM